MEVWPGARLVEVVPPGSTVGLVLLPPEGDIPVAVRLGTTDAEIANARLRQAGAVNQQISVDNALATAQRSTTSTGPPPRPASRPFTGSSGRWTRPTSHPPLRPD